MVSIVIPAYNCENIIDKCLESVINQTYADIEIIVVDDGSKDGTYNVVDSFAKKDSRIKLKTIKNSGPGGARNAGIDIATGDYLAFVDADDIVYPNYIETMVDTMAKYNVDLVICNMEMIMDYDNIPQIYHANSNEGENYEKNSDSTKVENNKGLNEHLYNSKKEILENLFTLMESSWYVNTLWCKMYKLSFIKDNSIRINEDIDMGEDFQFNIKYLDLVDKLIIIEDILYQYFVINSTLTGKYRPNMYEQRKVSIDEFSKFVDKYELDKNIIHYLYIKLLFADCMQMREFKEKYTAVERKNRIKELMNKDEIILAKKELKAAGITQKVLLLALKTNNRVIVDSLAWALSVVRKKCPGIKRMSI